jgi:putative nucleotidyltransferase with HDIG domain
LIIDPDKDFLKTVILPQGESKIVPLTANNGKDAQLLIADHTKEISAVFVNPSISKPGGISVIRCAHLHRPALPVYLIYDGQLPYDEKDLRLLGIQKALAKPITYDQILGLVTPPKLEFDADQVIAGGQLYADTVGSEVASEELDFSPIRAEDFLAGSVSYFDIYVRIGPGKYVKILQSGDQFSPDRIQTYLKKGVVHFYIRKEMQKHYLAYCDKLAAAVVNSPTISMEVKVSQSLNHGEEVISYLNEAGIDGNNIQFATQFIHNVQSLVKQLDPQKQPLLKELLDDVTAYEHGVGVAMIASLLFRPLKITSTDPVEAVGLSSLLHDIGLKKLDPPILIEDESKMTAAQKEVFKTHPTVGAQLLSHVKGIKPVVIQAVAQHHERRNKKGFPDRIGAGSISIVAEIVGISDEYFRFLQKQKEGTQMNLKFYLEHKIFNAFSTPLVAEFKKVFKIQDLLPAKPTPAPAPPPEKK